MKIVQEVHTKHTRRQSIFLPQPELDSKKWPDIGQPEPDIRYIPRIYLSKA